jgi:Ca2+-transporting ATPase
MNSETQKGLNDKQVLESRRLHGENVLLDRSRGTFSIFMEVVKEPMILVLIAASLVYFITQQYREGLIMIFAIGAVSGISIYQQIKSEKAIVSLRKLTQSRVIVVRNGTQIYLSSEEIVVGDLMIISEGQEVPADASILEQNDLSVDESILTGESFPVSKIETDCLLYAGTTVLGGMVYASVFAVGNETRIGKLGLSIENIRKEKTRLQIQVNHFVKQMAVFGVLAFLIVTVLNVIDSGDFMHGVLHGLALAMAVLPEEIPVALSTFMALGAYQMSKKNILVKHPQTVEALGSATVICVDKTGTITENKMAVAEVFDFNLKNIIDSGGDFSQDSTQKLILHAMLASEPLAFDPMEKAIHEIYQNAYSKKVSYTMIGEYPLSGTPPIMTHIYNDENQNRIIVCKGSPEGVINNSLLNEEEKIQVLEVVRKIASNGYVLGVGISDYSNPVLPVSQQEFKWKFSGLLAFSDPPKKNMKDVIRNFYKAGIEVKMITGDYPETACSIANQVGIKNPGVYITGKQILEMTDSELEKTVSETTVFARIMPETKLRIVTALKKNGEVVAMTGDGVNDGPALKAAHIGIAMGNHGSEVARQAASLVLTNDDLSSMVIAVEFGRKIFINLKQAIRYIISIHIPLISVVTIPLLLGWKYANIFNPVHIIFLELVMGPTCSIVYENEPIDKSLVMKRPGKLSSSIFTWTELSVSIFQGLIITLGLLFVLYCSMRSGENESLSRTLVFTTLIFCNILLTLTGRSKIKSVFTSLKNKNYLVPIVIVLTLVILFLSVYFPNMQQLFEFVSLTVSQLVYCFLIACISVLWIEFYKIRNRNEERMLMEKMETNRMWPDFLQKRN